MWGQAPLFTSFWRCGREPISVWPLTATGIRQLVAGNILTTHIFSVQLRAKSKKQRVRLQDLILYP